MTSRTISLSRLKSFLALSRTPHGLLDMATPILGALLWFDGIPSFGIISLGLITVFAGYTAVYALNDAMDYHTDKEKVKLEGGKLSDAYLDALLVRHPMAQGILSFKEGLIWVFAWGILALIGAFLLNPVCALIFLLGCTLEAVYCRLLRISYLRTLISGVVKTCGCIAAVFAVDSNPSPAFLAILFLWLFFWEIGGQNIPADWTDTDVDRTIRAKTIPVRFGPQVANGIILMTLSIAIILNAALFWVSPIHFQFPYVVGSMLIGIYFLFWPAFRLYRVQNQNEAMVLFNRASYYPLAVLSVVLIKRVVLIFN